MNFATRSCFRYAVIMVVSSVSGLIIPSQRCRADPGVRLTSAIDKTRPKTVDVLVKGKWKTGLHLLDSQTESLIIGRDGVLHTLPISERNDRMRLSPKRYEVASGAEMRNQLRAEFGPRFEVVATQRFLVVQPKSRGQLWPDTFERSHRAFVSFMRGRGVRVRQGRFPMIAVVLPDARAMYDEFEKLDIDASRVSGLYANRSNRVMTHDGGRIESIIATVRHEAAHQSAFNTGVHSRVNDTPSWITEGIGQLFEADGMAGSSRTSHVGHRANRDSIAYLGREGFLNDDVLLRNLIERMIISDQLFQDPATVHTAYATAWAMMFYLSERDHATMADVLNFTATRPPFTSYSPEQRRIDFERLSGTSTIEFAARVVNFLQQIR
ncbi:MAG: DUF1570 domain-containing protein [Planctomycetota bacterium]